MRPAGSLSLIHILRFLFIKLDAIIHHGAHLTVIGEIEIHKGGIDVYKRQLQLPPGRPIILQYKNVSSIFECSNFQVHPEKEISRPFLALDVYKRQ